MALVIADRVKETTTTTGTGTINLAGAVAAFQTFVAGIGSGNTCYYTIVSGNNWEIGIGTVTDASPDTLSRTTILASSNSDSALTLSGTSTVFSTYPADKAVFLDANGATEITLSKAPVIPYTTITGDTTVTDANVVVFANATSGAIDVTMYTADSNGGRTLTVKKTDSSANAVSILRAGSDTIDGVTSSILYHQNEAVTLISDNSNWFII
mgnify:FL=1